MDPIEALHAVAFQLERAGAPTYRVRAFRRAAQVAAELPRSELDRRVASGALEELAGIGRPRQPSSPRPPAASSLLT